MDTTESKTPATTPEEEDQTIAQLDGALGEWRTRLDDLKVQLDLAAMDAKDHLSEQITMAQNACLAARSRLLGSHSVDADLKAVSEDVKRVLHDLKQAYEAVSDVVRRSHS